MQKPFLTALIALLVLSQAPSMAASKKDSSVDYGAGSTIGGESAAQPGDPNYNEAGSNGAMADGGETTTAPASGEQPADQSAAAPGGAPSPGNANANAAGGTTGDASMDSMWSEPPSAAAAKDKSAAKKKTRTARTSKTKKSRDQDSALTNIQAPADSNASASAAASAPASASPSSSTASAAPAAESPSQDSTAAAPEAAPATQQTTKREMVESDPVFSAKNAAASDHGLPLCATQSFFQSELIRTVAWPGVGPFKGDTDPNDLSDPQENKLTLQTSGSKLTSAELILLHQPGNPQGFVNLEMVMDFLLEAMGMRDKRINDFNAYLEKNKEILAKNKATEEKPLTTSNGAYQISIAGSGKNNESSYLIQVKSKQAIDDAARAIDNEARPTEKEAEAPAAQSKPQVIASAVPPTKPKTTPVKEVVKETPKETVKEAPKETGKETSEGGDQLKNEFADTIRSWQSVKKEAVKSKDTAELGKFLSGKALSKQTLAIGWLTKEKKYYELTPKSVAVDSYKEISQNPKRYAVFAHVKEFSRLLDDGTNKLNKEEEAQYNVNYTIEKTGDHWTIYDSALVTTPGAAGSTGKVSTPASKTKH